MLNALWRPLRRISKLYALNQKHSYLMQNGIALDLL